MVDFFFFEQGIYEIRLLRLTYELETDFESLCRISDVPMEL